MTCSILCFNFTVKNNEQRQYKTVGVSTSQYTHSLAAFTSGSRSIKNRPTIASTSDQPDKGGVSVKHDSYNRYLNQKKARAMASNKDQAMASNKTGVNNKRNKNGIGILSEKCSC